MRIKIISTIFIGMVIIFLVFYACTAHKPLPATATNSEIEAYAFLKEYLKHFERLDAKGISSNFTEDAHIGNNADWYPEGFEVWRGLMFQERKKKGGRYYPHIMILREINGKIEAEVKLGMNFHPRKKYVMQYYTMVFTDKGWKISYVSLYPPLYLIKKK